MTWGYKHRVKAVAEHWTPVMSRFKVRSGLLPTTAWFRMLEHLLLRKMVKKLAVLSCWTARVNHVATDHHTTFNLISPQTMTEWSSQDHFNIILTCVLRAGRSGDRIPVEVRFSAPVQTRLRDPTKTPIQWVTHLFPGGKAAGTWG